MIFMKLVAYYSVILTIGTVGFICAFNAQTVELNIPWFWNDTVPMSVNMIILVSFMLAAIIACFYFLPMHVKLRLELRKLKKEARLNSEASLMDSHEIEERSFPE